jgi:hypothetical protein
MSPFIANNSHGHRFDGRGSEIPNLEDDFPDLLVVVDMSPAAENRGRDVNGDRAHCLAPFAVEVARQRLEPSGRASLGRLFDFGGKLIPMVRDGKVFIPERRITLREFSRCARHRHARASAVPDRHLRPFFCVEMVVHGPPQT